MLTVLALYTKHIYLKRGYTPSEAEDNGAVVYHEFRFLSYFLCLCGAFVSDSFVGYFWTITGVMMRDPSYFHATVLISVFSLGHSYSRHW